MSHWRELKEHGIFDVPTIVFLGGDALSVQKVPGQQLNHLRYENTGVIKEPARRSLHSVRESTRDFLKGKFQASPGEEWVYKDFSDIWAKADEANRNTQWRIHSLFFLDSLIVYAHKAKNADICFDPLINVFESWAEHYIRNEPSTPMAWHDHATAMRQLRLLRAYVILRERGALTAAKHRMFLKLIAQHGSALSRESFFSGMNNHGLDQTIALYLSAKAVPELALSALFEEVALTRFHELIVQQFVPEEGVHVENSPEYQVSTSARFLQILEMFNDYEEEALSAELQSVLARSTEFTVSVMRPDGYLPIIGDSEYKQFNSELFTGVSEKRLSDNLLWLMKSGSRGEEPEPGFKLYPKSGYALYSGGA